MAAIEGERGWARMECRRGSIAVEKSGVVFIALKPSKAEVPVRYGDGGVIQIGIVEVYEFVIYAGDNDRMVD